jgi:hypothetical protein
MGLDVSANSLLQKKYRLKSSQQQVQKFNKQSEVKDGPKEGIKINQK